MADLEKITSIRMRSKKGKRRECCEIEIGGTFWATLDPEIVVREGLKIGMEVNEVRRRELLDADETLRARRAAAGRSAMRPRSKAELAGYLAGRGFRESPAERALVQLVESGTVNDDAVARRWVRRRMREGGYGEARLESELRGLGVEEPAIRRALGEMHAELDPLAECRAFAMKKARQYQPLSDAKNRRRLSDLLRRRGFSAEIVSACLRSLPVGDGDELENGNGDAASE